MKIISAREAFEQDLTRYFTGKPCSHGHVSERMISNGSCVECLKARTKRSKQDIYEATKVWRLKNPGARTIEAQKYREKYPEKVAEISRNYYERNIEKVRLKARDGKRRMRAVNPERERESHERYRKRQELMKLQMAGREKPEFCEICNDNEFRIVFDHCHIKGNFRGWICDRCNRVLGIVKDSPELLKNLALYLEEQDV